MIPLLKLEFQKAKHQYIFLTALFITTMALIWGLHGEYSPELIKHGWRMFLYQLPLVNAIFLPILAMVVASRLCDLEQKGSMLKLLCCMQKRKTLYTVKLLYGLGIVSICVFLLWIVTIIFGLFKGFHGAFPFHLYALYFLFTLMPTIAIYILQYNLSLLFKNQVVAFFVGILGEFIGIFSMFLPSLPYLRKSIPWGYYGALQFVGMFGWTKETRYQNVHFDVMPIDWTAFFTLLIATIVFYLLGNYFFSKKEV